MDKDELRVLFAAFAMLKMRWERGEENSDAQDCWQIADKMLEEMNKDDLGIVAIKKRRSSWTKSNTTSSTKTAKQFE